MTTEGPQEDLAAANQRKGVLTMAILRFPWILVLLVIASLVACTRTSLIAQRDPAIDANQYDTLLVEAVFQDLGLRRECEMHLVKRLGIRGYTALPSVDILFPGREYTDEELGDIILKHGIDAWLLIGLTGSGYSSTYVPKTTYTEGSATTIGNTTRGSARTRTYGGYSVSKPWASFDLKLYDVATGEVAWIATAKSGGNAFSDYGHLVRAIASKAATQLEKDQLLRKTHP